METLDHVPVAPLEQEVAALFLSGQTAQALQRLEASRLAQTHPRLAFQLALLRLETGDGEGARQQLNRVLELEPYYLPALRRRAALLAQRDDLDAALQDFKRIAQLAPGETSALANAGVILLRRSAHADALPWLQAAAEQSPGDARIHHSLANALSGSGHHTEALDLFERLSRSVSASIDLAGDHALALLRAGQAALAHARFIALLAQRPDDQRCWAGRYLAASALGLGEVRTMMDYPRLLAQATCPSLDTSALRDAVLALPSLRWEPAGKSTFGGQQSAILDLTPGSAFHDFGQQVASSLQTQLRVLDETQFGTLLNQWRQGRPSKWRLQAWATILHGQGGHQEPHLHPAGWLSGVYYVDTGDAPRGEGDLVFGHPPSDVPGCSGLHTYRHVANTNDLLIFPSWFLHHTTPYHGARPRISLAVDLLPENG